MKNKVILIAMVCCLCAFGACKGRRGSEPDSDTVTKRDITRDSLRVDTNKNAAKDGSAGIKKAPADTSKK